MVVKVLLILDLRSMILLIFLKDSRTLKIYKTLKLVIKPKQNLKIKEEEANSQQE